MQLHHFQQTMPQHQQKPPEPTSRRHWQPNPTPAGIYKKRDMAKHPGNMDITAYETGIVSSKKKGSL